MSLVEELQSLIPQNFKLKILPLRETLHLFKKLVLNFIWKFNYKTIDKFVIKNNFNKIIGMSEIVKVDSEDENED